MSDIDDLELTPSAPLASDHETIRRSRPTAVLAVGAAALVGIGAWLGYWVSQRFTPSAPASTVTGGPPPTAAAPPTAASRLEGEAITLPPLADTDPLVRTLVGRLSSHPKVLAWLATDRLIANFTVVTLNIAEGRSPAKHLAALAPRGKFRVKTVGQQTVIDPVSYQRYDDLAAAIGALDATSMARLYLTLKPRIADAYRELGHPDGDFDPVLERALGVLLAVSPMDGDVALQQKIVTYGFADPAREALPPAARQLLRLGPANVRTVQAKLRDVATLLGLSPAAPAGPHRS